MSRRSPPYVASKYIGAAGAGNVIATGVGPRMGAITTSGRIFAALNTTAKTVSLIDTSSNLVLSSPAVGTVTNAVGQDALAFSPDGSLLFVANITDNTISRIVVATGAVSTIIAGLGPCACVVSPDGATCYVANRTSNDVTVVNTVTSALSTIPIGESLATIAMPPDGSVLFAGGFSSNNIYRIELPSHAVTQVDFGNHEQGLAFSADSKTLWVGTTQAFRSYSIATGVLHAPIPIANGATAVKLTADGRYLLGHSFTTNSEWKLDVETGVTTSIAVGAGPNATTLSPDSTLAYVACGTGNVVSRIVLATNAVSNIAMPGASVRIAVFHPLGRICYCPQATANNVAVLNNLASAA